MFWCRITSKDMYSVLTSITNNKGKTWEVTLITEYYTMQEAFNVLCAEFIRLHPLIVTKSNSNGNIMWFGTICKTSDVKSCVDSTPSASNHYYFGDYCNVTPASSIFQLRYN